MYTFFSSLLAVSNNSDNIPILYAHHDFISRILLKRSSAAKKIIRAWLIRIAELRALRRSNGVIVGADTELLQIKRASKSSAIINMPVIYPPLNKRYFEQTENQIPRIVHVGTPKTTANIVGLKEFFLKTVPYLQQHNCTCHILIIGMTKEEFCQKILPYPANENITFTGYVSNLTQYIRPYDIQVIPYRGTTGVRTRLYNAIRFKSAVVAFRKSTGNTAPFVNGIDLYAVDNYQQFNQTLLNLCADFEKRKSSAENAFAKLISGLTYEAYALKLNRELSIILHD